MKHSITTPLLLASLLLGGALHAAVVIGFEPGEGYSAGDLAGQPSSGTQWVMTNGNTNIVNVAAGVGNGGGSGLVNTATGGGSNFVYYGFNTTNSDLGGTFDSSSSILTYSFDWRPTQTLNGPNGTILFDFMIGSSANTGTSAAVSLRVHSSGRFQAYDGGSLRTIDGLFTSTGTYQTLSGTIDYSTNTFTVFLGATQLFTGFNGGNLAFQNAASDNAYIRFSNLRGAGDIANWREWNMDNIQLSIVPEPATIALLLGLAALGVALARRRR